MSSFDHMIMNTASLVDAALAYARSGLPVFPLLPGEKRPMVAHGFYSATTNLALIRRWWRQRPLANIGIACGEPSGWWVIDVDPRHGGWEALEQLHQDMNLTAKDGSLSWLLHTTRCQWTGGDGVHLLFHRRPDLAAELATMPNFAGYQGIDFKGERSYVVVAPSVHPSGKRYAWLNTQPLVAFPDTLVQCWRLHRQRNVPAHRSSPSTRVRATDQLHKEDQGFQHAKPQCYLTYAVSQATIGQRNRYALYLACRLVEREGLAWDQAIPWMLEYVASVPQMDHPYTEDQALAALDWALRQLYVA